MSLLKELLKLDWRSRINAVDALQHPYFRQFPGPADPSDIPSFEDSHEFDRRRFHDRKAALPPAPQGGTVGMGPLDGAGGGTNVGYASGDGYGGVSRNGANGRYPSNGAGPGAGVGQRNGPHGGEDRRPAWQRERGLPPRPPPPEHSNARDGGPGSFDGYRDRDRPPRSRGNAAPRSDVDTYIPHYGREPGRREERSRDDRRRRDDRDDRWADRDRTRGVDLDDRARSSRTRSRSRSPLRDRDRERDRDRDRDREGYRR